MDVDDVVASLAAAGLTVAVAESLTGGAVCAALVGVPGASAVCRGGVVAYATDLKHTLLGVSSALLDDRGAVDPEVALAMAAGVRGRLGSDLGVATTGVAGPDPQDGCPVGTVYVALVGEGHRQVRSLSLEGTRAEIRAETVARSLALLAEVLRETDLR
jgi:nicotinamide-nucleotide amidase